MEVGEFVEDKLIKLKRALVERPSAAKPSKSRSLRSAPPRGTGGGPWPKFEGSRTTFSTNWRRPTIRSSCSI